MTHSDNQCQYKYPRSVRRLCAEIVYAVTGISALPSASDLDRLHGSLCAKFDAIVKQCRIKHLHSAAAPELIYPLAALVDETFLSNPQYRYYWTERPLQLRYFGEIIAGTKFFSKLEAHISAREPNIDVLEAYFISLVLGLKGMYEGSDMRRCARVAESLGVMLRDIRVKTAAWKRPVARREKARKRGVPTILYLCGATAVSMVITAVIYLVSLRGITEFLSQM
ncbi:MAG: DotU family type IV/VI secretion system protein [Chitinispirillales bacterium]|nr:DotU family type IV/VI secretion system protein [Chitinispirillales bacterium]